MAIVNSSGLVIEDAKFSNDSLITGNWNTLTLGCSDWKLPNHPIFQVANGFLFVGLLVPSIKNGVLAQHAIFLFGFLLVSVWSWFILCAPDFFSWNFAFMIINFIQTLALIYHLRPIKFDENLEMMYQQVFQPMNVSRRLFKILTDRNFCLISTLYEGDAYAVQGVTKTDRLGMIISGVMKVYSNQNLLHLIEEMEFIDSPEFESSVTGDEKFQVSVYATGTCQYIYWPRQSLEYLFVKEPFLAIVLNTIMGRDITNKLYALNSRAKQTEPAGITLSPTDNSSPSTDHIQPQEKRKVGDLRRTLAQLSSSSQQSAATHNHQQTTSNYSQHGNHCGMVTLCVGGVAQFTNLDVQDDDDGDDVSDGVYSVGEEEMELLPHAEKMKNQSLADTTSHTSNISNQSGIHFTVQD